MFKFFRETPGAFLAAILVHLVLLAIVLFSLDWAPSSDSQSSAKAAPIQAVVVDADKLNQEVQRQEDLQKKKRKEEQTRLKELEDKAKKAKEVRKLEEDRLEDIRSKQVQEEKRIADLQVKAEKDARRRMEEKKKREAELKRAQEKKKAQEVSQREEEKKKAQARQQAEDKRVAEAQTKRKEQEIEKAKKEAKRKEEEKRQVEKRRKQKALEKKKAQVARKAKEAAQRASAEKALQDSLLEEERQSFIGQEINRFAAKIKREVERVWNRPPDSSSGLNCTVQVKLLPSGKVVDVNVVQSSGNIAFDRSVVAAVYKAEPLSVPSDPDVMQAFRTFNFKFEPR